MFGNAGRGEGNRIEQRFGLRNIGQQAIFIAVRVVTKPRMRLMRGRVMVKVGRRLGSKIKMHIMLMFGISEIIQVVLNDVGQTQLQYQREEKGADDFFLYFHAKEICTVVG